MNSFYDTLINISFIVVCGSSILVAFIFLANMIKEKIFSSIALKSFIIVSIIFAIAGIFLILFRSTFYTKTQLGRSYSIRAADEYLTSMYPKSEYKMNAMDSYGTVQYTVWIDNERFESLLPLNAYDNSKDKTCNSTDTPRIPFYLPF
ncbi:TPA: hypothetical protein ACSQRE_000116 [Clostridium perfringens]|uniref:hypothetical protein n=1 Tax=Clostridium perfringens TaxID=1502 RepID=UPI000B388418|nr:hypothetical protein [Clostridium perfringens]OUN51915.1 hypothetical protein B5G18_11730 [Clostridium perfringens]OUP46204.1 hypothetical protein B5F20_09550 [Clostridium perfringens]